jgi:hypothetical protein
MPKTGLSGLQVTWIRMESPSGIALGWMVTA